MGFIIITINLSLLTNRCHLLKICHHHAFNKMPNLGATGEQRTNLFVVVGQITVQARYYTKKKIRTSDCYFKVKYVTDKSKYVWITDL